MDFPLKIFFLRQLIPEHAPKVYAVKSVYHIATVCTMYACNFTKINSIGYTFLHWMVLNMKHLLEEKLKI